MALLSPGARAALAGGVITLLMALPARAGTLRVGDPAPALTLPDWHGGTTRLADLQGKIVVVDFWASWCVRCAEALPALDALARRHAGDGVVVVAVSIDASRATAEHFLTDTIPHTAMTILQDAGGRTLARLGVAGVPALYVVDPSGVVRVLEAGYEPARLAGVERRVSEMVAARTHTPAPP